MNEQRAVGPVRMIVRKFFKSTFGAVLEFLTNLDGEPGLSMRDVKIVADWVVQAERAIFLGSGPAKKAWVMSQILGVAKWKKDHIAGMLFYSALNYAAKEGLINLNS